MGENRGDLRKFARDVIDSGADLVLGHGPHVLRGMEVYQNKLIAYSLGNFATYGRFSLSGNKGLGVILEAELNAQGDFTGGKLFSTKQINRGIPVKDPDNRAILLIKKLSKEEQDIACFENFPLGETTANYRRHTKDKSLDPARDRALFKKLLESKPDDSKYWNKPLVVNEDFHTMQQELWKEIREERAARGAEAAVSSAAERKEDSELETKV